MAKNIQTLLGDFIDKLDKTQQKHAFLALPYAVVKKYGDDQASYLAALISYYGFISLFPLLIVATAVIQMLTQNNETLRTQFLNNATSYFPLMGHNLVESINSPGKSGVALVAALLLAFYGARGVALAIMHAQNHIWAVSRPRRTGFPLSLLRGFAIIGWGGLWLIFAASLTGYAFGAYHPWSLRLLLGLGGFLMLFVMFWGILTFGSSARKHPRASIPGALFAAFGLLTLQAIGGYIIGHQLRNQTGLNAQFTLVLAMLFWLYLQAQVFLFSVELNSVRANKLWPRAINPKPPLPADEKAYELYHRREVFTPDKD